VFRFAGIDSDVVARRAFIEYVVLAFDFGCPNKVVLSPEGVIRCVMSSNLKENAQMRTNNASTIRECAALVIVVDYLREPRVLKLH
jgi:hypothetical protein